MTTSRAIRERTRRAWGAALVGLSLSFACAAVSAPASAQTAEELQAARDLFKEAYDDEQAGRYAEALEKFERVAEVKESPAVRYRIASVLESLGKLRQSRDAFRALAAQKPELEPDEQDIADSAAERAAALDKRIPRLVLTMGSEPTRGTRVTVDGAPVAASTTPQSLELDPGEHLVSATAPDAEPFESRVTLGESGEVALTVPVPKPKPKPPPPPPPERSNTLAYVALGAGGVLLATSAVLLLVREGDISTLNEACPGGACPRSRQSELQSDHDQAKLFGPLGVGAGVLGLLAAGAGAYLLLRPSPSPEPARGVTVRLSPRYVRGGGMLGLGGMF